MKRRTNTQIQIQRRTTKQSKIIRNRKSNKMSSRGPSGIRLASRSHKNANNTFYPTQFRRCFRHFLLFFPDSLVGVFWGRLFSPPGPHVGAQGSRKRAKMTSKVIEKVIRRHLVEHAKTMAGTVREAYGEILVCA